MGCLIIKRYGKKGILLTLGMIFLSLTILGFAEVILNNSESSESRIKEFSETERVYNLDSSISKSFHRLVNKKMSDVLEFDIENGQLLFDVRFLNTTYPKQEEIINQLEIYRHRLGNNSYVYFGGKSPIFSKSEGIVANMAGFAKSTRLYWSFDKKLYVEYITYPYNLLYFNGFNTSNTDNINLTFRGGSNLALKNFEGVNICPGAQNCINITFNYDFGNGLVSTDSYGFKEQEDVVDYTTPLFRFNVTSDSGLNRTVAINWIEPNGVLNNLLIDIKEETSEGFVIMLPDTSHVDVGDATFETWYYGYVDEDLAIEGDLDLEVQIFMEGEPTSIKGNFMSHPMYNVSLPLLDTNATGRRVRYID
jgi:hypothetical protein